MTICLPTSLPRVSSIVGLGLLLLASGCSSGLQTVRIKPDPSVVGASVQVDVVALTASNQAAAEYPVSKYWLPGDPTRSSALKKIQFDSTGLTPQTVSIPAGTQSVAVIADLPGLFNDAPGSGDPRRKIIPATGKGVASEVEVIVSRNAVRVVAPTP